MPPLLKIHCLSCQSVCLLPSPAGHDQISLNESQSSGNSLPSLPRIAKLMKMGLGAKGILAQCLTSSNQLGSHCSWLLLVVLFPLSLGTFPPGASFPGLSFRLLDAVTHLQGPPGSCRLPSSPVLPGLGFVFFSEEDLLRPSAHLSRSLVWV